MNPAEAHQVWHGLRIGGTNLPGFVTASRFRDSDALPATNQGAGG